MVKKQIIIMPHTPEIAIIEQNTLAALGLRTIIEELIPHYFVSAQIYFAHTAFFLERKPKTIVLSSGEQPQLNGVPTLDCTLPQDRLVKTIVSLRRYGHRPNAHPAVSNTEHDLSPREIEVLVLVTKGYINKEIAERLNISLTTVISHRKNITEKLGIKSVSALAIYAVMHGYVNPDSV